MVNTLCENAPEMCLQNASASIVTAKTKHDKVIVIEVVTQCRAIRALMVLFALVSHQLMTDDTMSEKLAKLSLRKPSTMRCIKKGFGVAIGF